MVNLYLAITVPTAAAATAAVLPSVLLTAGLVVKCDGREAAASCCDALLFLLYKHVVPILCTPSVSARPDNMVACSESTRKSGLYSSRYVLNSEPDDERQRAGSSKSREFFFLFGFGYALRAASASTNRTRQTKKKTPHPRCLI